MWFCIFNHLKNYRKVQYRNLLIFFFLFTIPSVVMAQKYLSKDHPEINTEWKNYEFSSEKTILENLSEVPEFGTYVEILKKTSGKNILEKEEMVTVFVIKNSAFERMDEKDRNIVLNNQIFLESLIKKLAIPGRVDRNGMEVAMEKHGRNATFFSLSSENLNLISEEGQLFIQDAEGNKAKVTASNFYHKNGLFHIIDNLVFLPKN